MNRNLALQRTLDASTHALQSALARVPQARAPMRLSIPDETGGMCRLELVRADRQLSRGKEALVFMRMHRDGTRVPPSIGSLCNTFRITPAEARVLAALMAGQSPRQHAVLHGVSVHTVRSQVTALMTRMECTRQVDLVRKALLAP